MPGPKPHRHGSRNMTMKNRQILLNSRPSGLPTAENFRFVDADVPEINDGQVLLRTLYISVDPYMRGRMNAGKSYVPPFEVGKPISGGVVGQVVESKSETFKKGDFVTGMLGWQLYTVADARELRKLDPTIAPLSTALGILGITGLTAYFGLLDIGKPKSGETVVVSGAAGAVGMVVCQIAKLQGCRVVGIAGGEEKTRYLTEQLCADAVIDYKKEQDMRAALRAACPNGVDVYFDNVGGTISDAVLTLINTGARISICGLISQYNLTEPEMGLRPQPFLLVNRALMQGFIIVDYGARFPEGILQLAQWLGQGKLVNAEHIVEGFENTPEAFLGLFRGENIGKQIVKVAEPN
jgi:NADPH-dependent curcumin reductase CurA